MTEKNPLTEMMKVLSSILEKQDSFNNLSMSVIVNLAKKQKELEDRIKVLEDERKKENT